jgi:hypothetical protein
MVHLISSIVVAQNSIDILCANFRRLLVSGAEQSHSEQCSGGTHGAQDTNLSFEDWRPGYQDSGNELSISCTVHSAPGQIPNWNPARSKVNLNDNQFY